MAAVASSPQSALAIVGGELDGNRHSNVGSFVFPDGLDFDFDGLPDWDGNEDGIPDVPASGGNFTLIHPRVAVGAAHVFDIILDDLERGYYTIDELRVSFSPYPKQSPDTWLAVSDVILHPAYKPNAGYGATQIVDVAVVILKEPVVGITPAALAPVGFLDLLDDAGLLRDANVGAPFTVVGYGNYGSPPNAMMAADGQRRVAVSEFMHLNERWVFLDQNAAHGNSGSANRDSGGPTFWIDPYTGDELLVAIISNGDAAGVATGINFRLDTAEVINFIDDVIARLD
jgi:hypothetical protein